MSDRAAEYLSELVMKKDYAKLEIINHLFLELCQDYDFYNHEENGGEEWLCEEISVKTKTVIKTLLWSGMKNLQLLFIYSIQRIL